MLCSRLVHGAARVANRTAKRQILSAAFSLDKEWSSRHAALTKLGLGGDYEWISAVQKKFIGGGIASAVDVDAAVCVAEQKDQVNDVIELLYKLRHSENAADLPPSAEYAAVRLLLKHDPTFLFKLAQDPINYGVFMNEHSACLAIDYFVKRDDFASAARLASWVMQQEMFDSELLNLLCIFSCAKWAELPADQQVMPREEIEEEDINEDDIKTFKFPYLKNPHFDSHFDLVEFPHLAGKTLLWMGRECKSLDKSTVESIRLLGAVLYHRLDLAESLAGSKIDGSVAELVRNRLKPSEEGAEPDAQAGRIIDKLASCQKSEQPISAKILEILSKVQEKEEKELTKKQIQDFKKWNHRRQDLIKAQAERVLLKVRSEELAAELTELESQREKLYFFENRLTWEKKAAENAEITKETTAKKEEVVKEAVKGKAKAKA